MPIINGGGSGSSVSPSTLDRAIYFNATAGTIVAGAHAAVSFGAKVFGDAILDLTDPTLPLVIAEGVFSVMAQARASALITTANVMYVTLELDANGADTEVDAPTYVPALFPANQLFAPATLTWYVPAGGALKVVVYNNDSVDHTFAMAVVIQKVA